MADRTPDAIRDAMNMWHEKFNQEPRSQMDAQCVDSLANLTLEALGLLAAEVARADRMEADSKADQERIIALEKERDESEHSRDFNHAAAKAALDQRDEWMARAREVESAMREWIVCYYCDRRIPAGSDEAKTHNKDCPTHPMRAVERDRDALAAQVAVLTEALEVLSRLGNGERPGNSNGNVIAQRALRDASPLASAMLAVVKAAEEWNSPPGGGLSGGLSSRTENALCDAVDALRVVREGRP